MSGRHAAPGFENVAALAAALGLRICLEPHATVAQMVVREAKRKAKTLVAMLQGTSGLEGQALDAKTLRRLRRETARDLLAGSKRNLW